MKYCIKYCMCHADIIPITFTFFDSFTKRKNLSDRLLFPDLPYLTKGNNFIDFLFDPPFSTGTI